MKLLLQYLAIIAVAVTVFIVVWDIRERRECAMWEKDPSLIEYQWQKDQCEALK